MVLGSSEVPVQVEKWRGKFKSKPKGRPPRTPDWRLRQLLEPSLRYIEGIANGEIKEPNATRITLAWKMIERYGGLGGNGKRDRVSGIEGILKEE